MGKITTAELAELFGASIPVEAATLLHSPPPGLTTDELRVKLRALTTQPVDDRPLNTNPVDHHETTDLHTQADDLVERLKERLCLNPEAAAYIKELKAEVERWKEAHSTIEAELTANERQVDVLLKLLRDAVSTNTENCRLRDAAEARAAKAEEALRRIADPREVTYLEGARFVAREALGEGKA